MNKVKSMTGYGREAFSVENADFSVEISSVNQRGLAISVSAPPEWTPAADRLLAPLVRARVARGKITLALRLGGGRLSDAPAEKAPARERGRFFECGRNLLFAAELVGEGDDVAVLHETVPCDDGFAVEPRIEVGETVEDLVEPVGGKDFAFGESERNDHVKSLRLRVES